MGGSHASRNGDLGSQAGCLQIGSSFSSTAKPGSADRPIQEQVTSAAADAVHVKFHRLLTGLPSAAMRPQSTTNTESSKVNFKHARLGASPLPFMHAARPALSASSQSAA